MNQESCKESKLIKKCKKGDQKALFTLYQKHVKSVFNISIRYLNNKMDAEDVVQESFIKAFNQISSLKNENAFGCWVKMIARNSCISILRKRNVSLDIIDEINEDILYDDDINEQVDPIIVNKAIKKLPAAFRIVVNLHVFEGKKHKEISEILDITESTSKARYRKAKMLLAEQLSHIEVHMNN